MFHHYTDLDIRPAADLQTATMRCNVLCPMEKVENGEKRKILLGGNYDDKLENTPQGWRFVHRIWSIKWIGTWSRSSL